MSKYISTAAFSQAEDAAFIQNKPIRELLVPDGGDIEIIDIDKIKSIYPARPINGHKGTFGHLTLIVGSDSYPGAAQISALAALHSGIGIASVLSVDSVCTAVSISAKEATFTRLEANSQGQIHANGENLAKISAAVKRSTAVLFGCGVGNSEDAYKILEHLIKTAECPIIIDADGINALAKDIELLRTAKAEVILTPHIGELASLAETTVNDTINRRTEIVRGLSSKYNCLIASKSSSTLISYENSMYLSAFGNDGLAKGGSGDLLAGIISSFAAQHIPAIDSAILGVAIQGIACDMLSEDYSPRGILASDIANYLPLLFKKIERHEVN